MLRRARTPVSGYVSDTLSNVMMPYVGHVVGMSAEEAPVDPG